MIKKFLTLAVVAALFVACGEEKPTPTPNPGGDPGNTETPEEPEEPEFVGKINIDGDFADWDALAADEYVVATLPEGECLYPVLKTFKMHADEIYIYIFLEFNPKGVYTDVTDEWSGVHYLDLFIDEDNDPATGRYYAWSNCAGYMLQGAFHGVTAPYNPSIDMYIGEDGEPSWAWEDLAVYGVITSVLPVVVSEEVARFECSLLRPLIPFEMAETIGVGAIVETEGWTSIGQLPQNAVEDAPATEEGAEEGTEENTAARPAMLYITLPPMAE